MVCDTCKVREECATWEYIEEIQKMVTLMLSDMICENIEEAIEKFSECEYKEWCYLAYFGNHNHTEDSKNFTWQIMTFVV